MDGACSTILLGNIFPNMDYNSVFFGDFLAQYEAWSDIDDYDAVFVVGMVLDQSLINKIDDHKVIFISDRAEKLNVFDSKLICEETTSCSKLIYKKFKDKFEIPADLKKLILYVDGYNSYTLKHKESEYLNGIYRNTRYNRFNAFVKRWWNGYDGLTDKELQSAQDFFSSIEEEYARLDKFEGKFKNWTVLATFSKLPVNEIAKKLIDNGEHDVIVVVNTDTQFVSFRKRPESTADLAFIAENLCNGGGSANASGGKISQKFLDFTTKLEQI
jgi:nanoRNase/pAp phosphatase (c-di-AMP/oligoRNAs hydrolase)